MPVNFYQETFNIKIPKSLYKSWIRDVILQYNFKLGTINIIFYNISSITRINKKFLKHNYATDIITFNFNERNIISGDIYLCIPVIYENSVEYSDSYLNEISRVIIHGVLHLIGYDDKTTEQQKIMRILEDKYLNILKEIKR